MEFYWPRLRQLSWFRFILPLIVYGLICYSTWSFSHELCYDQVYKRHHRKDIAIGLICAVVFLDILLLVIWFQLVVLIGPGKQPKVSPFMIFPEEVPDVSSTSESGGHSSLIPPLCYQCDPNGYPIWCSICQSLKMERVHHASNLGYCVPRFDHRCIWIGTVVGKDNYRLFFQFLVNFAFLSLIVLVSICVFIKEIIDEHEIGGSRLSPNLIVALILSGFGLLMTGSMVPTYIICMIQNKTSLEFMARRTKSPSCKKIFCYYNEKDGYRYVVEFESNEYDSFWKKPDLMENIYEYLGPNVLMWFVPVGFPCPTFTYDLEKVGPNANLESILGRYKESFGNNTIELIEKKISQKEYLTRFHAYGDKYL